MIGDRRVFLEVRDPEALVRDLEEGRALFVPTRLPLSLNSIFILGVRLRNVQRALELPMIVVGRRVPRGGSLLSGGVMCKLADPSLPMFHLLREYASGGVVDLELRIQEQHRVPARAHFVSLPDAISEIEAMLDNGSAQLPLDRLVQRGDRLALTVSSDEAGDIVVLHVLVRGVYTIDGQRGCSAALLDDASRARAAELLRRLQDVRTLRLA